MKLSTSNVISIIAILMSLLFGGGWLSSYFEAKEKYRNDFLVPLETLLSQNKRIFDELTNDVDIIALEYAPNDIQREFNALEDSKGMSQTLLK